MLKRINFLKDRNNKATVSLPVYVGTPERDT